MNNSNDKIKTIDSLLDSDIELDKYISSIENSAIEIPNNLENDLLLQFNTSKQRNIFKENTLKILKIVACTTFALIMWNYLVLTPIEMQPIVQKPIDITTNEPNTSFKDKLKIANDFLITPLNFERNDK